MSHSKGSMGHVACQKRAWSCWWQQQRSREQRLLQACEARRRPFNTNFFKSFMDDAMKIAV